MEEQAQPGQRGKWNKRLAILSLGLFAIFWSLGPFFFWMPLAFAAYFSIMAFANSDLLSSSIRDFQASFKRQQPANPYQTFRPRPTEPVPSDVKLKVVRVIRGLIIFFVALFAFFFVVGILVGNDDDNTSGSTDVSVSPSEEDGTTAWNEKGNTALSNEKYDSAVYYYEQALAIDPENMFALYNKGLSYTLRQDYRRANMYARQCVHFHPDYNPALWLLGYNYDLMNNTDSALYFLEKAYVSDYSQPDFLQLMAEVYFKKDRRSKALEVYQKMVGLDTTRADIFRKMAELDPANADAYRRRASALDGK